MADSTVAYLRELCLSGKGFHEHQLAAKGEGTPGPLPLDLPALPEGRAIRAHVRWMANSPRAAVPDQSPFAQVHVNCSMSERPRNPCCVLMSSGGFVV